MISTFSCPAVKSYMFVKYAMFRMLSGFNPSIHSGCFFFKETKIRSKRTPQRDKGHEKLVRCVSLRYYHVEECI